VEEIFDVLLQMYGDKVPIGTILKKFNEREQLSGEIIRSYAHDLQESLEHIIKREPDRVSHPDAVFK